MRTRSIFTASSAAAVLLSSCAVGPSVHQQMVAPQQAKLVGVTQPDSIRTMFDTLARVNAAIPHPDTVVARPLMLAADSGGDVRWLDLLHDSTLVQLVDEALRNNSDIQIALGRVEEYRASLGVAKADLFPSLSVNANASSNQVALGFLPPAKYKAIRATADLTWELDFWGRIRRNIQAARGDYDAYQEDERSAILTLVSDVATAYLQLRELDEDLVISQRTLASRQVTLNLAQQRYAQGQLSELDVRQFQAQVAQPAANVAQYTRQIAQQEHQLSLLLGREPGPILRGRSTAGEIAALQVPDSIASTLIARRPDVRKADRQLEAATARIGVAVAGRLPKVTLTGSYGRQNAALSNLFPDSSKVYQFQAGVSIPIFDGGKLINQQRAATARAEQARATYRKTVLTALQEANDALVGVQTYRDQATAQSLQVTALRQAANLAELRYRTGVSSYLEVLDAQRSLYDAELAQATVRREQASAAVQLYKALGGSWTEEKAAK